MDILYKYFGNLISNHRFVFQKEAPQEPTVPEAQEGKGAETQAEAEEAAKTEEKAAKAAYDKLDKTEKEGLREKVKTEGVLGGLEKAGGAEGIIKTEVSPELEALFEKQKEEKVTTLPTMRVEVDPKTGKTEYITQMPEKQVTGQAGEKITKMPLIHIEGKVAELTPKQQKILDKKVGPVLDKLKNDPDKLAKKLESYKKSVWKNVRAAAEAYAARLGETIGETKIAKAETAPEAGDDILVQLAKQAEQAGLTLDRNELVMTGQTYNVLMKRGMALDKYLGKAGTAQKLLDTLIAVNTKLVEAGDKDGFKKLNQKVNQLAVEFDFGESPRAVQDAEAEKANQRTLAQNLRKAIEEAAA